MTDQVDDGYDGYYTERLWQLLPGVFRTADTDSLAAAGPLRELLTRVAAQIAVVRRSIDRLWADQSIETCDDWVIPYIGDLLGTNLVNSLDPAGQRLDVAKTIHYRRRKGTLPVLEELARDVTGWPAHVVEGFRRLARTRHGLDPAVGPAGYPQTNPAEMAQLLETEGLRGVLTGGLAGGYADLRSLHGAALAGSAFDESFHTADVRVGRGALGHFGIPKLLVFVWRLRSFKVSGGTPVRAGSDCWVFDPTGREIPLFLPMPVAGDDFADTWTPAREIDVPGPLTTSLWQAIHPTTVPQIPPVPPYPYHPELLQRETFELHGGASLAYLWPEDGGFTVESGAPASFTVDYHYGFSSTVGAGPYDRDLLPDPPPPVGDATVVRGGTGLDTALTALGSSHPVRGTVTIADSQTYSAVADVGTTTEPIDSVVVRAGAQERPVMRGAGGAATWTFTGGGTSKLVLDGLTVSGQDIVLRGAFTSVRITACTVDPGTAAAAPAPNAPLATAVDGQVLAPCHLWIEADPGAPPDAPSAIQQLTVDHSITGPIRTRYGGAVETLSISDSIVQGLPTTTGTDYSAADIFDPVLLADALTAKAGSAQNPVSAMLYGALPAAAQTDLQNYLSEPLAQQQQSSLPASVIAGLTAIVDGASLWTPADFASVVLSADVEALAKHARSLSGDALKTMNRGLVDESYPFALGVAALAVAGAAVELTRVTVLGATAAQRLSASDSILTGFTVVEDRQDGCVRFSATTTDSAVPRQYESVQVTPEASLFVSDAYGQPGYGQLLESADMAVVPPRRGAASTAALSILTGADTGSEMGAFSADLNPIREQGLLIKFAEYMPLGLTPVIVHVT